MTRPTLTIGGMEFTLPFSTPITPHEIPRKAFSTLKTIEFISVFSRPETDVYGLKLQFRRMAICLCDSGCIWTNILSYSDHSFVACSFYRGVLNDYFLIFTSSGLKWAYIIRDKNKGGYEYE